MILHRELALDYETASEIDLPTSGLDVYSSHPSTRVLMVAWSWDRGKTVQQWTCEDGTPFPQEVIDGLLDPTVVKRAFNAQFEWVITLRVLRIASPVTNWRCTMVLAYMQSFVGTLDQIGGYVGLPEGVKKLKTGKQLIGVFCKPRKPSKNDPLIWRNAWTNPEEWEDFCFYNRQDVVAECGILTRLIKFPIEEKEWELYERDLETNLRGIPIDMEFVESAIRLSALRKAEITSELVTLTGLSNPNSPAQLLGWLRDRGFPFNDLRADTVKKVLTQYEVALEQWDEPEIDEDCAQGLKLRQQVARTSTAKYTKLKKQCVDLIGDGDYRFRFGFQYFGAQRTGRAAGRGLNPQNLTRTPKEIEPDKKLWGPLGEAADFMLVSVTDTIRRGDYSTLKLTVEEPLDALAGTVRSAIAAPEGYEFHASDLSSIETCMIAWLSGCERLLNVFRNGQDPYIDFGTMLYNKAYDDVTKRERQDSKPAVLGAGFRLGGGELREGKRTGLWGYAENMGVNLTQEQSVKAVKLYRDSYPEVPKFWYALEKAVVQAVRTRRATTPIIEIDGRKFRVPVVVEMMSPYLTFILPSGRRMYYYKPRITKETRYSKPTEEYPDGRPYEKEVFSYIGREQGKNVYKRISTHGGKICENLVQATARDVLQVGYRRAVDAGFEIVLHVYDELVALVRKGDNRLTPELLRELMIIKEPWMEGLPLNAAVSTVAFYRKD